MLPQWHYLVEISGCCNLVCVSCPNGNSLGATRAKGIMDMETFKKIIDKISHEPVAVEYISLYNWGEPLLNPHVAAMIDYVNSFRYRCTISSNLNNQTHLESVIRANPFQFRVSVSGFSNAMYSRTHTGGNIEKVKDGMRLMRQILDKYHSSTIVEVCYHQYRDNTGEELLLMQALCEDLGFKFVPTWAYFMPLEKSIICCDGLWGASQEGAAFSLTKQDQDILQLLAIQPEELRAIHIPYKDKECTLRASQTAINFDGSVSLCCGVWDDAYRIAEHFCSVSHYELQRRKYTAPFCTLCRSHAQHMVGINYDIKRINETAEANVMHYALSRTHAAPGNPSISVIITAYNYGRFLGKAIESVLSQDFTNFELIILNNASTDNTNEVVKRYLHDPRIRYIVNETNIGGLANGNKGLLCAKAPYIFFLSADDFILPNALSVLHHVLTVNSDVEFVYGRYFFVDQNNAVIQEVKHPGWLPYNHKGRSNEFADLLQFDCYISMPTVLFKRSVFEKYGDFSDKVRVTDYEFFIRLAAKGCKSFFINKPLAAFRVHGNQMSIGGDVISSGSQINDQLTLLEMYLVPEYFPQLAGFEAGIIGLLVSKIEAFNRCSDRNMEITASLQQRIQAVVARVAELQLVEPNKFPMVSVIVPTKNRPEMLKNALQSILNQTYGNFEILVVNDGGDDIQPLIDSMNKRNNIRCIRHEISRDRSAARNSGLKTARGKYIAYLDDDDRYYPDHLRVLVNFLETKNAQVVYADAYRALEEIENGAYVVKQRQLLYSYDFNPEMIFVENLFPNLCIMHAKSCTDEVGMFDETLGTHEDWDMWIRLSLKYRLYHLPVVTAEYSYRNDKTNTTTRKQDDFLRTRKILYNRYHDYVALKPHVLEAQKNSIANNQASIARGMSMADFMQTVTSLVEQGQLLKAIDFYDNHRSLFAPMPDLDKFDELVALLRGKVDGVQTKTA